MEKPAKLVLCNSFGPEVHSWYVFFSRTFRVFLHLFYIEHLGFSVVFSGRNREKYIYIFWEEGRYFIFITMLMLILMYLSISLSLSKESHLMKLQLKSSFLLLGSRDISNHCIYFQAALKSLKQVLSIFLLMLMAFLSLYSFLRYNRTNISSLHCLLLENLVTGAIT